MSRSGRAGASLKSGIVARDLFGENGSLKLAKSQENVSCGPLDVWTTHRSPAASPAASARRTLNWCPQWVQRTVVPRPLTSASSNSYSVLQRSH